MSSKTQIINAAIDHLGEDAVLDPSQKQDAARRIDRRFDAVRDALLEEHRWNFAMGRKAIASGEKPAGHWGSELVFPLPVDYIKVRSAGPKGTHWRVEGDNIVADASSPLQILYTRRVEDSTKFSPLFAEALSLSLAHNVAWAVTGSQGTKDRLKADLEECMVKARHADAVEHSGEELESSEWLEGMLVGPGNPFGTSSPDWGR